MLKRRFTIYIALLVVFSILAFQSRLYEKPSHHILVLDFNSKEFVLDEADSGSRRKKLQLQSSSPVVNNDSNIAGEGLPSNVIESVQRFVFFVGYARSGHSVIASLLDAHPNVIIAHEYSLFSKWTDAPVLHSDKQWLFTTLFESSKYSSIQGWRNRQTTKKGYSLSIPGWWQGKYKDKINVIGDKAGGMTAQVFRKDQRIFNSSYFHLQKTLGGLPISVIHVLRNPYDNIATMLLYNVHKKGSVNVTNKYVNDEALTDQILSYFRQVKSVMDMIKKVPLNVIEVHNVDMISNPKKVMKKICSHLRIDCPTDYLHMCAEFTYPCESRSRELVQWTDENIQLVADNIQRFHSLVRYSHSFL